MRVQADNINGVYKVAEFDGDVLEQAEFYESLPTNPDGTIICSDIDSEMAEKIHEEYGIHGENSMGATKEELEQINAGLETFIRELKENAKVDIEHCDYGTNTNGAPIVQEDMSITYKGEQYYLQWQTGDRPDDLRFPELALSNATDSPEQLKCLMEATGAIKGEDPDGYVAERAVEQAEERLLEEYDVQQKYDSYVKETYGGEWEHDPYNGWRFEKDSPDEDSAPGM